ncbi:MAG TPA: hypothetical protein VN249_04690 [Prolixibacteraceae bacterium]|nr:hypothetical protein [Prolixibacteraceae bacterium]
METSSILVLVAIAALAVLYLLQFYILGNPRQPRITLIAGLAFGFILAGFFYNESRMIGYGLTGIGIILAIIDIIVKFRKNK